MKELLETHFMSTTPDTGEDRPDNDFRSKREKRANGNDNERYSSCVQEKI